MMLQAVTEVKFTMQNFLIKNLNFLRFVVCGTCDGPTKSFNDLEAN